jgi:protein TonB
MGAAQGGPDSARDRLVSMLLLAALLHGLLILGVRFGPLKTSGSDGRGLEVVLVSDELPEAKQNETATYRSQRTQLGSGNTQERVAARVPGAPASGGAAATPPAPDAPPNPPSQELLSTQAPRARLQFTAAPRADEARATPTATGLPLPPSQDAATDLALRGRKRDELYVTADTRASDVAPYLDGWRRRVERIGTLNYPSAAQRRGLRGNPVVEVAISRDGKLASASIRRSSGHPEIDAAALDILRLASPFDPFPPELGNTYRVLRFAYEWQFVGGRLAPGNLSVP